MHSAAIERTGFTETVLVNKYGFILQIPKQFGYKYVSTMNSKLR